ncbi:MAG: hypothetical protein P4L70_01935 [Parasulfuritortus sp.]|jgi:hypothetical protein|nr:hypothetical protein [Parasulfuritortus sp.]
MNTPHLNDIIDDSRRHFGYRWRLPEYRQIELYTKRKKLVFLDKDSATDLPDVLGVLVSASLLEDALLRSDDDLMEGKTSWERYLALPRVTTTDKLVAEVYRILRVFRIAVSHAKGHLEMSEGLIRTSCTFKQCALSLNITPAGLSLLESFVHVWLDAPRQPYSEAYVEALLMQYFTDIVVEIRKFADQDRVLYQFHQRHYFNRHQRLDCDNPRFTLNDGTIRFEIGPLYADPVRYPIDFFVSVHDRLHIVPVEALKNAEMPEAELARWQTRPEFATALPDTFRSRFGREVMVVGLPMT